MAPGPGLCFCPTWEFFTHMETSPWPVKGCKFWPMLGNHGHWAVRILYRATPTETHGIRLYWSSPRTRDTHTYCRTLSSGAVTTCFYDSGLSRLGFEHPTFRLRSLLPTAPPPRFLGFVCLHYSFSTLYYLKWKFQWF